MDQIFNELSANGSYNSKYDANKGMEKLIHLSIGLKKLGFNQSIRAVSKCRNLLLVNPNYNLQDWAKGADRDLKRWFYECLTQKPYVDNLLEEAEGRSAVEFTFEGDNCSGLGLAHLSGCGALSLDGDVRFCKPSISVHFLQIDQKNNKLEEQVNVDSWYSEKQLDEIADNFYSSALLDISSGESLLSRSNQLFPFLAISKNAEKQVQALTGTEQHFKKIVRHLHVLNKTMNEWEKGIFTPLGITTSPESEATLQQYSEEHTFRCVDGKTRLFSHHSKLISENLRIYYYPDTNNRIVHIGYVGKHLPTVAHPT
ncbi:MAG: hypothetical protein ACR2PR_02210 [Pseudohongiellaceae bacterium]